MTNALILEKLDTEWTYLTDTISCLRKAMMDEPSYDRREEIDGKIRKLEDELDWIEERMDCHERWEV